MKRVFDFNSYVENRNKTNESKVGDALSKAKDFVMDKIENLKDFFKKFLVPSGPKKGAPAVSVYLPSNGDIVSQIDATYKGTEFAKMNPLQDGVANESLQEARVSLEYTGEDQTVRNVNAPELKEMIEKLYRAKERGSKAAKPIFIFGAPGIGKTQIVGSVAQKLGIPMINLDVMFMAPEDFLGIPKVIDLEVAQYNGPNLVSIGAGATRSNPPLILPRDNGKDGKGGIIFMDEMNRANRVVLDAMMQFVQMGRIGEYNLPDRWILVAAGNRAEEANVTEFDFAFADRFRIVNFVPKIEDWADWASVQKDIDPIVVNFIRNNEKYFHYLDTEKGTLKFPTPRSWTDAARMLNDEIIDTNAKDWRDLSSETIYNIFTDSVGPEAAAMINEYLKVMKNISDRDFDLMLTDPEKAKKLPKDKNFMSLCYGISDMAINHAAKKDGGTPAMSSLYNIMKYFNGLEHPQLPEILSALYKNILNRYPEVAPNAEDLKKAKDGDKEAQAKLLMVKMVTGKAKEEGVL
jgi:hypothetical protein